MISILREIGKHVEKIETWNPQKTDSDTYFSYIDLSSVDKDKKVIDLTQVSSLLPSSAPSRARQIVKPFDVLISTVRPNLNGVAYVPSELDNATASTGYCVLRANNTTLDSQYLFYWVQTERFVNDMMSKASGANYPAVSDKIIKQSQIPLQPLVQQQKIAAILDAADSLRQKDRQLVEHYTALSQSLFLEMFGDPVTNPMGWDVKTLKDLADKIMSGNTPKGGRDVYVEKGVTFFRSQNVWRNKIKLEDVAYLDEETHASMRKSSLKYKDILMTKTGRFNTENSSLGRAAMYLGEDDKANVNGHVYLIRLKDFVINEFVLFILTTEQYRDYIRRVCVGGIDKRQINKNHLEDFPIINPPINLQRHYTDCLEVIEKLKQQAQTSLEKSEALFNSLLHRAFTGELTAIKAV